jgi:hypothetical protein
VLFPGGGESPTFPRVRLDRPSLWSAISGISVRAARVSGAGLWSSFFNFHFGGARPVRLPAETGSQSALGGLVGADVAAINERTFVSGECTIAVNDASICCWCYVTIRPAAPARPTNTAGPWRSAQPQLSSYWRHFVRLNPKKETGQHAADRLFEEFTMKTQKTQTSNTSNQGMVIESWHRTGFCRFC